MSDERVIHLIDDDDAVRDSLAFLLGASGFRVKTYESGLRFLQDAGRWAQGCVITDIRMPDLTGLELAERLKQSGSSLPVIVVTGHADMHLAIQAIRIGAVDFIEKPFEEDVILRAIEAALQGPGSADGDAARSGEFARRVEGLSQTERQVLDLVLEGRPNEEVAHRLVLDLRSVEACRATLMTKMQVNSLSELVRLVLLVERGR